MHPPPHFEAFLHLPSLPQALQAPVLSSTSLVPGRKRPIQLPMLLWGFLPTPQAAHFCTQLACELGVCSGIPVASTPSPGPWRALPSRCSASLARREPFTSLPTRTGWDCSSDLEEGPGNSLHTRPGPSAAPYGRQGRNPALTSLGTRREKEKQGRAPWNIFLHSYHPQAWE